MFFKNHHFSIKFELFNFFYALFTIIAYNFVFFNKIWAIKPDWLFLLSSFIVVTALLNLLVNLLFITPKLAKTLGIILIFCNCFALYFMLTYNVLIDKIMILNVLRTNIYEAEDVLHGNLVYILFCLGLLPAILIYKTKIISSPWRLELKQRVLNILISSSLIALMILPNLRFSQNILINHLELRYTLVPSNYIGASIGIIKMYNEINAPFTDIATDAKLTKYWQNDKKNLIVMIVGETARAANFSLNGYHRPTNAALTPYLKDIAYYSNFYTCGTSTAVAVPCMFSQYGREEFKPGSENTTANLIDVMEKTGYKSLWRDNNTSCQNNCDRIELEVSCTKKNCFDDVLLQNFSQKIRSQNQNMFLILHQRGSHGPDYYNRYPTDWNAPYQPTCKDPSLKSCSPKELINAYDNSIIYSNLFFVKVIKELEQLTDEYNPILIYASDHGESLGENGQYLHGYPYESAPSTQTHIPAFTWIPPSTSKALDLDISCLQKHAAQAYSHDNIFHSILGLAGISTSVYQKKLDIFSTCQKSKQ